MGNSGPTVTPEQFLRPNQQEGSFSLLQLIQLVNQVSTDAKAKLNSISQETSSVSIGDMFSMQMLMNHLSQMGEMASSVVSAINTAFSSLTRGIKGQ
jgi:hypothetical protein